MDAATDPDQNIHEHDLKMMGYKNRGDTREETEIWGKETNQNPNYLCTYEEQPIFNFDSA